MTNCELNLSSTIGEIRFFRVDPDELINTYQLAVEHFDNGQYPDSLRAIRVCLEKFSKDVFVNAFPEKNIPEGRDCIRALDQELADNMEEVYEIIGVQLETAYQIACKASHDDPYEITEGDAAIAHHLFDRCVSLFRRRILHSSKPG